MFIASGCTKTAGAQPIAAMHCCVILLQGIFPGAGELAMSMQSIPAIEACNDPVPIGAGTIAIAVDWPIRPPKAASSRQI